MNASSAEHDDTLTRLEAENAIHRLLATYCHNLDDGKFTENAVLLQHATMEVLAEVAAGRDEIERFFESHVQRHGDETTRTWHTVSNVIVDVDPCGTRATSASYFVVHQELGGFPLQPICTGRYHDTFEKKDGHWRFSHRLLKPRLFGDLRFHAVGPIADSAS